MLADAADDATWTKPTTMPTITIIPGTYSNLHRRLSAPLKLWAQHLPDRMSRAKEDNRKQQTRGHLQPSSRLPHQAGLRCACGGPKNFPAGG